MKNFYLMTLSYYLTRYYHFFKAIDINSFN